MSAVLFLTQRMTRGFGVSVVVENISRCLEDRGVHVTTGCQETDGTFADHDVRLVTANRKQVKKLVALIKPSLVVAHTTPFFEILPSLNGGYRRWAWEHGDPTPAFFPSEAQERQAIVNNKRHHVYPKLDRVIAISEFVRYDIAFENAIVIPNGCDHVPLLLPKDETEVDRNRDRVLKVGALMRLGTGESQYKGSAIFIQLATLLSERVPNAEIHLMGRGTEKDAMQFREHGITVHLNATEEEKFAYLRSLDVFVSLSLWEGFNLPLVEAEALGTVGLAFDTGAHPEVTPFVLSSMFEMVELIQIYADNPSLLQMHSRVACQYVRQNFSWVRTADRLIQAAGTDLSPSVRTVGKSDATTQE